MGILGRLGTVPVEKVVELCKDVRANPTADEFCYEMRVLLILHRLYQSLRLVTLPLSNQEYAKSMRILHVVFSLSILPA
jgi:hypothetical protein